MVVDGRSFDPKESRAGHRKLGSMTLEKSRGRMEFVRFFSCF